MCGIVGFVSPQKLDSARDIISKMNATLSSRGPDEEGVYTDELATLAHKRLSIIDLSSGKQPMTSPDGRYTVVFNGEIYNFLDIKKTLEQEGAVFQTHSDTEVLLHLYRLKKEKCLDDLNGMFAFAIWDKQEKTLFAARDRAGKKPFYYGLINGHFVFASELKAFFLFPFLEKKINASAISHFMTYEYVPAPLSILEGVFKLKQAHFLKYNDGKIHIERYWNQPFGESLDLSEKETSQELMNRLSQAVSYRLISDVPLGVFLSGGIDSSAVVALMAQQREGKDIKTFSINFQEASYDESSYSSLVAKTFGTDHHTETLTAQKMLDILPQVTDYLDEPFADGSILPTYLLSHFTRKHVTVALGGDGADEQFAGYPTFYASRYANFYQKLPGFLHRLSLKTSSLLPTSDKNMSLDFKVKQFLLGARYPDVIKNQVWLSAIPPVQHQDLFASSFYEKIRNIDPFALIEEEMQHCLSQKAGDRLLYFYQKFYMCDDILFKVDRASMANSLEVRAPFLDKNVIEFTSRLSYQSKLKGHKTKYLLKKCFHNLLPHDILYRPKKGFGIPISAWLKNELKPLLLTTLSQKRIEKDGIFAWPYVKSLIDEHLSGKCNWRKPLFALLMFHFWLDKHFDSNL